jgi:nicotinate dehydrogenase subunit A
VMLLDARAARCCVTEIDAVGEAEVTTIEGPGTVDNAHALQQAFIGPQAAQWGIA